MQTACSPIPARLLQRAVKVPADSADDCQQAMCEWVAELELLPEYREPRRPERRRQPSGNDAMRLAFAEALFRAAAGCK